MQDTSAGSNPHRPLAASIAAILMLAAPLASAATTWTVNTCNEANVGSGTTGSLRYAAANAVSGDTIDMANIGCSTITLTTGAIFLPQDNITVNGPGKTALTIIGSNDRVFTHNGHGAFALNDLSVANGYVHPSLGVEAKGGCISSNGKAYLFHVGVHSCNVTAVGAGAHGGGVYARDLAFAKYSDISGNVASGTATSGAGGGGIFSYRDVLLASSTVSGNSAAGGGGGVRALLGNATFVASTISGNTANIGGGIYQRIFLNNSNSFSLSNSTVSGNLALNLVGGAWTNANTIEVKNSTVAFNSAGSGAVYSKHYSAGFNIDDIGAYYTDINHYKFKALTLQSSVFSNNVSGLPTAIADDIGITRFSPFALVRVGGQNNLVVAFSYNTTLTTDTVTYGVCPLLGPLRDNGGPTKTHALFSGSFAIDHGNNTHPYPNDQRGLPRPLNGTADIGAYEVQQADIVFNAGFDGCP